MAIEHKDIADPDLHEPKGVSSAAAGSAYISDGAGSGDWKTVPDPDGAGDKQVFVADGAGGGDFKDVFRMGWEDYADSATASTPITLTPTDTFVNLTNDGLGSNTNTAYALPGIDPLWDTTSDELDFSGLELGDTVTIRIDSEVTTSGANHAITWAVRLGVGGTPYELPVYAELFKSAGTYHRVITLPIYIGDSNTKDNPGKIMAKSDTGTSDTVEVNGWFIEARKRGGI